MKKENYKSYETLSCWWVCKRSSTKKKILDFDYTVVNSFEEEFFKHGYKKKSDYYPVYLHPKYPQVTLALARKEKLLDFSKRLFSFQIKDVSLEEDLFRRDFTVNAIAFGKKIIDPYGGLQDLKKKLLKPLGIHFKEDPLRFFRAARFAAQLDFELDLKETYFGEVSLGKQEEELRKVLSLKKPQKFFILSSELKIPFLHVVEKKFLTGLEQFLGFNQRVILFNFFYPKSPIFKNKKQDHLLKKILSENSLHSFVDREEWLRLRSFLWVN